MLTRLLGSKALLTMCCVKMRANLKNFDVIDSAINLSDLLPLLVVYTSDILNINTNVDHKVQPTVEPQIARFRFDHSNLSLYYPAFGDSAELTS